MRRCCAKDKEITISKKFLLEDPALNWKTFLRVIGVCLAAYLFMNLGTQAIKDYSDPAAIAVIAVSILVICGVLRIHNQAPVAPIMYALGNPLGRSSKTPSKAHQSLHKRTSSTVLLCNKFQVAVVRSEPSSLCVRH